MGNCFGKQSDSSDSFKSPGRTLGTAPAPNDNARASVPPKISSQSPGRTLGSAPQGAAEDSPKAAAARAAEVRDPPNKRQEQTPGRMSTTVWL